MDNKKKLDALKKELKKVHKQWWNIFHGDEDQLKFRGLLCAIYDRGLLDETDLVKSILKLMKNDIAYIRKHLKDKANSKKDKSPFHFSIFNRFINFVVRMFRWGR